MASLGSLFLILSAVILLVNAQHLSTLQLNKNFQVNPPITEKKVLNAFKRANPGLPPALSNGGLFVSALYQDNRAIIDVVTGTRPYFGFVEVYFNGGRPYTPSGSPTIYGPGKINLSNPPPPGLNVNLNLRSKGVTVTNDAQGHKNLIKAFMDANPKLPTELNQKLKVKDLKRTSARLYVVPGAQYEGEVYVTY